MHTGIGPSMNLFRNWRTKRWKKKGKQKRAQVPQNPELYHGGTFSSLTSLSSSSSVAPHIICVSSVIEPTKTPINYLAQTSSYTPPSYPTTYIPPFSPMQQAACYSASLNQPQQQSYIPQIDPS